MSSSTPHPKPSPSLSHGSLCRCSSCFDRPLPGPKPGSSHIYTSSVAKTRVYPPSRTPTSSPVNRVACVESPVTDPHNPLCLLFNRRCLAYSPSWDFDCLCSELEEFVEHVFQALQTPDVSEEDLVSDAEGGSSDEDLHSP